MKRVPVIASVLLVFATALHAASPKRAAAPVPDFWYVVPGETPVAGDKISRLVQGIVVPASVRPTVQTTPAGSIIAWQRPDGTRQSFVIQGLSSFSFESGPIAQTTYVRFFPELIYRQPPRSCCSCASWLNSEESVERLACVGGCSGCGCEGCICSPRTPCPIAPEMQLTLVAHNDAANTMTFSKLDGMGAITLGSRGDSAVQFHGRNVAAAMSPTGATVISDPESITLPGGVADRSLLRDDKAFFAWSSPDASVILEQPRSMPPPSFHDGTIDLGVQPVLGRSRSAMPRVRAPMMDECSVCGTHPNSVADLDIFECVPGDSVCYRCITWTC